MELPFETENYNEALSSWPGTGKHILACFTQDSILLFQAYKPSIADWVVQRQTFQGCPEFSLERMTWVKTNFLWMMYRSGWGTKPNQEKILAISVKKEGFEQLLRECKGRGIGSSDNNVSSACSKEDEVRLQWDPDHDPFGNKVERRAIQLGIRGNILKKYVGEWILSVNDITEFVREQYSIVQKNDLDSLKVPRQRVFSVSNEALRTHLGLDECK